MTSPKGSLPNAEHKLDTWYRHNKGTAFFCLMSNDDLLPPPRPPGTMLLQAPDTMWWAYDPTADLDSLPLDLAELLPKERSRQGSHTAAMTQGAYEDDDESGEDEDDAFIASMPHALQGSTRPATHENDEPEEFGDESTKSDGNASEDIEHSHSEESGDDESEDIEGDESESDDHKSEFDESDDDESKETGYESAVDVKPKLPSPIESAGDVKPKLPSSIEAQPYVPRSSTWVKLEDDDETKPCILAPITSRIPVVPAMERPIKLEAPPQPYRSLPRQFQSSPTSPSPSRPPLHTSSNIPLPPLVHQMVDRPAKRSRSPDLEDVGNSPRTTPHRVAGALDFERRKRFKSGFGGAAPDPPSQSSKQTDGLKEAGQPQGPSTSATVANINRLEYEASLHQKSQSADEEDELDSTSVSSASSTASRKEDPTADQEEHALDDSHTSANSSRTSQTPGPSFPRPPATGQVSRRQGMRTAIDTFSWWAREEVHRSEQRFSNLESDLTRGLSRATDIEATFALGLAQGRLDQARSWDDRMKEALRSFEHHDDSDSE
ncbi:hypothetical protein CcaverHIS002_0400300 [Cutaneotrichosporon cavernicola]|uniref:Uncharacterized protein n=1 Tax=Cutaneotrichosporon cavernicola TaxID=279322 RepID=A0AA48L3D7_9TREE|nr:uncharacterized protein CcaverHIS019_0400300 [Cutaneotrichosporon cavernicola]BEI83426.1 hypothetical protein CcaverHIS002_0400300 [Cutaneotrichosporon cavernicola]BEI91210.1 hypothetical protein CcaverHIS019_0400300 [Cutaneotrichosporon cavernicola]BEI98983.1 hypothetical protein CcaverHIS631_0400260 [Cutaneotrichosporon cavernicola]BEJ06757.1 hypothetical protein CcaverHIS641_0400260 [Cutaneotrichosporon cavernicola]